MSTYQEKQKQVIDELERKAKEGKSPATIVESMDNYADDKQICLTSVVFLDKRVSNNISRNLIELLRRSDNQQYYYPPDSLHITIQTIRIIHDPPAFTASDIAKTKQVFAQVVPKYQSFMFELKGLLELPTSLAIRAYSSKVFGDFVLELRTKLSRAGIPDDKKYVSEDIVFGNTTICRYTTASNKDFNNMAKKLKNMAVGETSAKTISLITTNAVCHPDKTKILATYNLK